MLPSLLCLLLAQAATAPQLATRNDPRLRGGLSLALNLGWSFVSPFSGTIGAAVDAGVLFNDRYGLSVRLAGSMIYAFSAALLFDLVLTDHTFVSAGAAVGAFGGIFLNQTSYFGTPIRLTYLVNTRKESDVARSGFAAFVEMNPGYTWSKARGPEGGGVTRSSPPNLPHDLRGDRRRLDVAILGVREAASTK